MEVRVLADRNSVQKAPGFAGIAEEFGDHAIEGVVRRLSKVKLTDDGAIALYHPKRPTYTITHGDLLGATDPDGLEIAVRTLGISDSERPPQTVDWTRRSDGTLDLALRNVTAGRINSDDQLTLTFADSDSVTVDRLARFKQITTASHQVQYQ